MTVDTLNTEPERRSEFGWVPENLGAVRSPARHRKSCGCGRAKEMV